MSNNKLRIEYDYKRCNYKGNKNKDKAKKKLGENLSRHHAISYPHMYEFGAVLLTYFHLLGEEEIGKNDYFQKFLRYYSDVSATSEKTIRNTLLRRTRISGNGISYIDPESMSFLNQIAWTKANLFVGPSEKLRADDPAQGLDTIPVSMSRETFVKKAIELRKSLNDGKPAMVQGQRGFFRLSEDEVKLIATEFIRELPDIASKHKTRVSDWYAVSLDDAGKKGRQVCYQIFFSKNHSNKGSDIKTYKLELVKAPAFYSAAAQSQNVSNQKVVVITDIIKQRSGSYLLGVLRNLQDNRLVFGGQANNIISEYIKGLTR